MNKAALELSEQVVLNKDRIRELLEKVPDSANESKERRWNKGWNKHGI